MSWRLGARQGSGDALAPSPKHSRTGGDEGEGEGGDEVPRGMVDMMQNLQLLGLQNMQLGRNLAGSPDTPDAWMLEDFGPAFYWPPLRNSVRVRGIPPFLLAARGDRSTWHRRSLW